MSAAVPSVSVGAAPKGRSDGARAVFIVVLGIFALSAAMNALRKDVRVGFDELAHISYVAELQRNEQFWPRIDGFRLLEPSQFRFTDRPNYLNHPGIYYWILARLCSPIEGHPESALMLRACNVLLASIGFAALMALGLALKLGRFEAYAYCLPIFGIPVLAPIAGSMSNDNLAFAGGCVALLAAQRVVATARSSWFLALLAGMALAGLAKFTALILVGAMTAGVAGLLMLRGRFRPWWILLALAAGFLVAAPYLVFLAQYGQPAPDIPGAAAFFKCPACMFEDVPSAFAGFNRIAAVKRADPDNGWRYAPRLSFPAFAGAFVAKFFLEWAPTDLNGSSLQFALLALPIAAALCGLAGLWVSARRLLRGEDDATDGTIVAGWLAIMLTFACHLIFSYKHHLDFAYVADAWPRLYLPLLAVVALAGASLLSAARDARLRPGLAGFLIVGPVIVGLLGSSLTI
ncbi:MAG TPA: hypothetical protein VEH76_03600 [Methylocystis sp.]|nr:hypothetical protein [Methylocystis sp.]